jgi:hypothetical protein
MRRKVPRTKGKIRVLGTMRAIEIRHKTSTIQRSLKTTRPSTQRAIMMKSPMMRRPPRIKPKTEL